MTALLQAKAAGPWSRSQIRNNVLAGVVVGVDLVVAVNVGVILAALFFLRRMADSVNAARRHRAAG